jgi:hypothetical protein
MDHRCAKGGRCQYDHPSQHQKADLWAKWSKPEGQSKLTKMKRRKKQDTVTRDPNLIEVSEGALLGSRLMKGDGEHAADQRR